MTSKIDDVKVFPGDYSTKFLLLQRTIAHGDDPNFAEDPPYILNADGNNALGVDVRKWHSVTVGHLCQNFELDGYTNCSVEFTPWRYYVPIVPQATAVAGTNVPPRGAWIADTEVTAAIDPESLGITQQHVYPTLNADKMFFQIKSISVPAVEEEAGPGEGGEMAAPAPEGPDWIRQAIFGVTPRREDGAYPSVVGTAGGGSGSGSEIVFPDPMDTNTIQLAGNAIDLGAGNVGAGTQRVTIATDDVNLVAIGVDTGSISTNTGTTATNTGTIVTNTGAIAVDTGVIVTNTGTTATNTGTTATNTGTIVTNTGTIVTNTGAIAVDTGVIATNTGTTATNTGTTATNTGTIVTNTGTIVTNTGTTATNTGTIVTNTGAIAVDTGVIATNTGTTATNTGTTATNTGTIVTNTGAIAVDTGVIATNTGTTATNTGTTATNTGTIVTNTGAIAVDTGVIATNTGTTATNTGTTATNTGTIVTNTGTIVTNTGTIATNTGTTATNTTNIAVDTGNISTNTATTATNTGNCATSLAIMDDWDAVHDAVAGTDGVRLMGYASETQVTAVSADGDNVRLALSRHGEVYLGSHDYTTQSERVAEIDPIPEKYEYSTIFSLTNAANGTYDYYIPMAGYMRLDLQLEGLDIPAEGTVTVWGSIQADGTAPASLDYQDVTNLAYGAASFSEEAMLVDNTQFFGAFNYVRIRLIVDVSESAGPDVTCYAKKSWE